MRDEPCVRELAVHAVYGEAISLPATALNAVQMVRIGTSEAISLFNVTSS